MSAGELVGWWCVAGLVARVVYGIARSARRRDAAMESARMRARLRML